MEHLNVVNLIQAGIAATGILGFLLLWMTKSEEFRGIAVLLFSVAFSACINILEESGLTRDFYLISPIFIMLFGPLTYLAAKLLIEKKLAVQQYWHLFPVLPFLLFTSYTYAIIGLGTAWRLMYATLTILMLLKYKRSLDEARSDADDFSLSWLIWVLIVTAFFNLIDLVRLNFQYMIAHDHNVIGQGINNLVWLVAIMVIIIKLQVQKRLPQNIEEPAVEKETNRPTKNDANDDDYHSIFTELDKLIIANKWFLQSRLTLQDISLLTGLQTRDISRAINLITKKSFNEYINNYRVEYVCVALSKEHNKSLTDIYLDAGFSSKASFNKVFKGVTGLTPSEYKSQYKV